VYVQTSRLKAVAVVSNGLKTPGHQSRTTLVIFLLGEMNMKSFVLLACVLLLSACGTTGPLDLSKLDEPIPADKARIIVTRDSSLLYLAAGAEVRSNGAKIANLGRGGSVIHDIPKGNNVLSVSTMGSFGRFTVTFDAKPREVYEFVVSPRSGALVTGAAFGMIGDAINASVSEQSGYFQIGLKDVEQ